MSDKVTTSKQWNVEKVTAVEKSDNVKAKDPRKVELGKRLAKISKEAKERKARQREADREADRKVTHEKKTVFQKK